MNNKEDIPFFVASLVSNAYPLNSWIPNTHLLFYKMFCSPKLTQEERTAGTDLLEGNIFDNQVSKIGYQSLLHSVLVNGKKKHFKKTLEHMQKYMDSSEINDEIVSKVIDVSSQHDFPILLGLTMKNFMEKGVKVSMENYVKFYMYLDRCKGFEKDTLRFIFAVNDTEHIQTDWEFLKPLFSRAVKYKKGKDILELFELIKSKLQLNKKNSQLPEEESKALLDKIKVNFYKGLIDLMLKNKAFVVADFVYKEYRNQVKSKNQNDTLGIKISGLKKDLDSFESYFNEMSTIQSEE
jgi:hypothetical protein